ncbi:MAG: hypothetical protein ACRD4U_12310 [Candidatus Acidiferrales bacterium]
MKKIPFSAKFVGAGAVLGALHSYLVIESMRLDERMAPHLNEWHRDFGTGILFVGPVGAMAGAIWCYFKAAEWPKPPWLTARRLILFVAVIFAFNLVVGSVIESTEAPPVSSIQQHSVQAFFNPVFLIPYVAVLAIGLWWSLNPESEPASEMERLAVLGMSLGGLGGLILIAIRQM